MAGRKPLLSLTFGALLSLTAAGVAVGQHRDNSRTDASTAAAEAEVSAPKVDRASKTLGLRSYLEGLRQGLLTSTAEEFEAADLAEARLVWDLQVFAAEIEIRREMRRRFYEQGQANGRLDGLELKRDGM